MSNKVLEIQEMFRIDEEAMWVSQNWSKYRDQMSEITDKWTELRNYVFATDTTTTSNSSLPWKNSTTIPKLCQIRDNLHANYNSSLFPNDRWLQWVANSSEDATREKREVIQEYIANKARGSHLRTEVSKLLYDYIDYGNAFVMSSFENNEKDLGNGDSVKGYIGPRAIRVSPLDIVFNPLASSFDKSFKIIRSIKTLGELQKLSDTNPDQHFWKEALDNRVNIHKVMGSYSREDFEKAIAFDVDGFGNLYEYFQSDYVEVLEFYGDFRDSTSGVLQTNRVVTIVDRSVVVRNAPIPSWMSEAPIRHVGWRNRPDNLWHMGPLDNLVGMQYRIDHLENLKADAMDLVVHPPLKIIGEVEEFNWGPNSQVHLDEGGDVGEISKSMNGMIAADNNIRELEDRMELMAGAPREAAGIRTPGEKTALEVQTLSNAAGRIFQDKITHFETELLEPLLNDMLETSVRNMNGSDVIRVIDDDVGVQMFQTITREDITANGRIRPIGARHFAKQAQDLQNLMGVLSSPIGQMIAPHTSAKELTKVIDDIVGLSGYNLFRTNVAVEEQMETEMMVSQAQEDVAMAANPGGPAQ